MLKVVLLWVSIMLAGFEIVGLFLVSKLFVKGVKMVIVVTLKFVPVFVVSFFAGFLDGLLCVDFFGSL